MNLRDELTAIHKKHGSLTPQLVVEVAREEAHPLHGHVFDRAPAEAAEAWYRHRAHELVTSVFVTYKNSGGGDTRVRAFHAVRQETEENGGYVYEPVEDVVADPFLTKIVFADMEREWRTMRRRYDHFKEFWEMVQGDAGEAKAS